MTQLESRNYELLNVAESREREGTRRATWSIRQDAGAFCPVIPGSDDLVGGQIVTNAHIIMWP